jgi:hypothetical protein
VGDVETELLGAVASSGFVLAIPEYSTAINVISALMLGVAVTVKVPLGVPMLFA